MAAVERTVNLDAALREKDVRASVFGGGGFVTLRIRRPADTPRAVAVAESLGLEAWPRRGAPPTLRVGHPRFGDVVVVAPLGTAIVRETARDRVRRVLAVFGQALGGSHGHRPETPEMAAIFVAFGAGAPRGARLGTVRNLDVAPTVLARLGIPIPTSMEGRPLLSATTAVPSAR